METYSDTIWISEKKVKNIVTINPDKITNFLGRECGLLVFDAHEDFMLDCLHLTVTRFKCACVTLRQEELGHRQNQSVR